MAEEDPLAQKSDASNAGDDTNSEEEVADDEFVYDIQVQYRGERGRSLLANNVVVNYLLLCCCESDLLVCASVPFPREVY